MSDSPVHNPGLSPGPVQARDGSTMRVDAVFPVIHTLYYLYKEYLND